ncbi:MAG TPA: NADPH:quinone oxidoreductase family protein [Acidimicrobiales bacterium]
MRAVVCQEIGPPSALRVEDAPPPVLRPGGLLVEVEAAGVNYVDALFVQGRYQIKPPVPFTPGSEIAGTVTAVGDDVTGWQEGDRVLAMCGLGGFAEQVAIPAASASKIPSTLDAPRAATFTQSYCTALFALRDRAHLTAGETVLVLGAGGGVGQAAIDVARSLGANVIGAASSGAKRDAARAMGAQAVIDTTTEDVKDRARQLARDLVGGDGHPVTGVDVVIDPLGGDLAESALRALGEGGRFIVIGFAAGAIPALPANQILLRNRSVVGVDWGAWAMAHGDEQHALLASLLDLVAAGELHPVAPVTYPLERAGEALDDLLERRVVGKVALVT